MQIQPVPNVTLKNIEFNAGILGLSYIHYAESLGFAHEYDVLLNDTTNQGERYLLLKKLLCKKLTDTKICKKVVGALADNCASVSELLELRYAVAFSEQLIHFVSVKQRNFPSYEK